MPEWPRRINEEMRQHLDDEYHALRAKGVTHEDAMRRLSPDVLHYHLYASALAVRLASIGLRIPRVHMVAGPLYLESPPIRAAERVLARLDTVTISGSEFTARRYRELGRPAERCPAIPYGFDTQYFQPLDARSRRLNREPRVFALANEYAPRTATAAPLFRLS